MRYELHGTTMQTLEIELLPGEQIFSQTATMAWMTAGIRMDTNTGGGVMAGLKRSFTGGGFFITQFTADALAKISFAARFPGTIMAAKLGAGESIICRKDSFMCAQAGVSIDIAWQQRIGAGFFAGEGFVLQRITGPGIAFIDLAGEMVNKDLAPGEVLYVHAGHIGIQSPSIKVDIRMMRGFRNILFGGEGLFMATLTGPGRVGLQSMPLINLAESLALYGPGSHQSGSGPGSGINGVFGGISNFFGD